ncbi:Uncharacterised protein g3408 [Pycnogonum litorale]
MVYKYANALSRVNITLKRSKSLLVPSITVCYPWFTAHRRDRMTLQELDFILNFNSGDDSVMKRENLSIFVETLVDKLAFPEIVSFKIFNETINVSLLKNNFVLGQPCVTFKNLQSVHKKFAHQHNTLSFENYDSRYPIYGYTIQTKMDLGGFISHSNPSTGIMILLHDDVNPLTAATEIRLYPGVHSFIALQRVNITRTQTDYCSPEPRKLCYLSCCKDNYSKLLECEPSSEWSA